jgi:hypothetical protein
MCCIRRSALQSVPRLMDIVEPLLLHLLDVDMSCACALRLLNRRINRLFQQTVHALRLRRPTTAEAVSTFFRRCDNIRLLSVQPHPTRLGLFRRENHSWTGHLVRTAHVISCTFSAMHSTRDATRQVCWVDLSQMTMKDIDQQRHAFTVDPGEQQQLLLHCH